MQREAKRRRALRRGVMIAIVAVLVLGSAALLFSSKSPPKTTTTTVTTASSSTTSTPITTTTSPSAAQKAANAVAVAAGCPSSTATRVNTLSWKTAPAMTINKAKTYYAHFVTTAGNFVVKLDPTTAPITVNNFVFLAQHQYYKCVIFHRVIPGFVIQGGDPTGVGTGGPGYTIADEYPKAGTPTYPLYSLAMANTGSAHSGGSQFFIVTGSSGEQLPPSYSLFGLVISGQSVVQIINKDGSTAGVPPTVTQRMISVTISEA